MRALLALLVICLAIGHSNATCDNTIAPETIFLVCSPTPGALCDEYNTVLNFMDGTTPHIINIVNTPLAAGDLDGATIIVDASTDGACGWDVATQDEFEAKNVAGVPIMLTLDPADACSFTLKVVSVYSTINTENSNFFIGSSISADTGCKARTYSGTPSFNADWDCIYFSINAIESDFSYDCPGGAMVLTSVRPSFQVLENGDGPYAFAFPNSRVIIHGTPDWAPGTATRDYPLFINYLRWLRIGDCVSCAAGCGGVDPIQAPCDECDVPEFINCPINGSPLELIADPGECCAVLGPQMGTTFATGDTDDCGVVLIDQAFSSDPAQCFFDGDRVQQTAFNPTSSQTVGCAAFVAILDQEDPDITCGPDFNVQTDAGECFASLDPTSGSSATDNCNNAVITPDPQTFAVGGPTTYQVQAEDGDGNTATCNLTVTVSDSEAPTVTCPMNLSRDTDPGVCEHTAMPALPLGMSSDNCGPTTASLSPTGSPYPLGDTTITINVEDSSSPANTNSCTYVLTVEDNENPTITCRSTDQTAIADGACMFAGTVDPPVTLSDNCAGVTSNFMLFPSIIDLGTTTVTHTAMDDAGNTATCSFDLVLTDETGPTIGSCPASQSEVADANCLFTGAPSAPTGLADNCATPTATANDVGPYPLGTTTITYTVSDGVPANDNTDCVFELSVRDTTPPSLTCEAPYDVDADSNCVNTDDPMTVTMFNDNCGTDSSSLTFSPGPNYTLGANVVTFTADDNSPNSPAGSCTTTITVVDVTDPSISCPSSQPLPVDSMCQVTAADIPAETSATDNCGTPTVATSTSIASVSVLLPYDHTSNSAAAEDMLVTHTASINGGSSDCSFTLSVQDTTPPMITCPANETPNADSMSCSTPASYMTPGLLAESDNCQLDSVAHDGTAPYTGTNTVTYRATDLAGNTATCSFTISVQDNEPPVITCPPPATVSANANCEFASSGLTPATATDNCDPSPAVTNDAPTALPLGSTSVTWTATSGTLTDTCVQTVTVVDMTQPTISCPSNPSVSTDSGICTATRPASFFATGTDNCGATVTSSDDGPYSVGATTVTFTNDDGATTPVTCDRTITVTDDEPPVIVCTTPQTVSNSPGLCTFSGDPTGPSTATDNCGDPSITFAPSPNYAVQAAAHTITFTATDDSLNPSTCTTELFVEDGEDPNITCPTVTPQANDPGACNARVTFPAGSTSDNCDMSVTVSSSPASNSAFDVGSTTVTQTATDDATNTAMCSFAVQVFDDESPVITCSNIAANTSPGQCSATVNLPGAVTVTDNCNSPSTPTFSPTGPVFGVGSSTVTASSTDGSNSASCDVTVTVTDNESPTFSGCPLDMTFFLGEQVVYASPSSSDNCAVVLTGFSGVSSGTTPADVGIYPTEFTATDAQGNVGRCQFDVIVVDPGIIELPNNLDGFVYMYVDILVSVSLGLFPSGETEMFFELRSLSTPAVYQSETVAVNTLYTYDGIHKMIPDAYEFWVVFPNDGSEEQGPDVFLCSSPYIDIPVGCGNASYNLN